MGPNLASAYGPEARDKEILQRWAKTQPDREGPDVWLMRYPEQYAGAAEEAAELRRWKRMRDRERRAQPGREMTPGEMVFADMRRDRARLVRDINAERAQFALRSDQDPILMLFVTKIPRLRNLRVGSKKGECYQPGSKMIGLDEPYVEDNKRMCGILRIDLDGDLTVEDILRVCRAKGVPAPNLLVGTLTRCRFERPHLMWLLYDSMPMTESDKCARFSGLRALTLRGLTDAFIELGADPEGMLNSFRHKNPLSLKWEYAVVSEAPHDMSDIASKVNLKVGMKALRRKASALRKKAAGPVADHPDAEIATGSNRFWACLTGWAKAEFRRLRDTGVFEEEFAALVAEHACALAADMTGDAARSKKSALGTAAGVAKWTWNFYRPPETCRSKRKTSDLQEVARRQQEGGRIAAAIRSDRSASIIVGEALRLAARLGRKPRRTEVAAAVFPLGIRNEKTVRRHWHSVELALAGNASETGQTLLAPYVKEIGFVPADVVTDPTPPVPAATQARQTRPSFLGAPRHPRPAAPAFLQPAAPGGTRHSLRQPADVEGEGFVTH